MKHKTSPTVYTYPLQKNFTFECFLMLYREQFRVFYAIFARPSHNASNGRIQIFIFYKIFIVR